MMRALTVAGTGLAVLGAVHAAANLRRLVRPVPPEQPVAEPVAVLIPARNEADRIGPTITAALAQRGLSDLSVTVLDDGSGDSTHEVALTAGGRDPRLTVLRTTAEPPPGWLGKPYACQRLAVTCSAQALVFLDADVVLHPDAVASAVRLLRQRRVALASAWPRQVADGPGPRIVQPLQQWSWATTLPLGLAARSTRPSLAAANGQFLVVDRSAYLVAGGHAAVADCVLEDIELARAMKRSGQRVEVWDGSRLAACQMYDGTASLRQGYRKSLWAAIGPRNAPLLARALMATGVMALLSLAYVVPPIALLVGPTPTVRAVGAVGYIAAVANRAMVANATGGRVWPDSLAHPISIVALAGLTADSFVGRATGRARWKGRPVTAAAR